MIAAGLAAMLDGSVPPFVADEVGVVVWLPIPDPDVDELVGVVVVVWDSDPLVIVVSSVTVESL